MKSWKNHGGTIRSPLLSRCLNTIFNNGKNRKDEIIVSVEAVNNMFDNIQHYRLIVDV